ncbi:MAG: hypothetical protein ACI4S3_04815 [Candidatus Gastranaerophilaceae bacterium]
MLSLKEKFLAEIEDTENNIKYFDVQLSFLNSLKKNTPEVELAFNGESFEDLFKVNRETKTKYILHLNDLKRELAT